jgi:hypothetical protein
MRKYLGYILFALSILGLAGPVALASDGGPARNPSLPPTTSTVSPLFTDTPTVISASTPSISPAQKNRPVPTGAPTHTETSLLGATSTSSFTGTPTVVTVARSSFGDAPTNTATSTEMPTLTETPTNVPTYTPSISPILTPTSTPPPTTEGDPTVNTDMPTSTLTYVNIIAANELSTSTPTSTANNIFTHPAAPTSSPTRVQAIKTTSTSKAIETATVIYTVTDIPVDTVVPTKASTSTPGATSTPTATSTVFTLDSKFPQSADFAELTLNGAKQTKSSTLDSFVVTNVGGTGAGWLVMIQAERFTTDTGRTLALGSLSMSAPSVSGSGIVPIIVAGPYAIDSEEPVLIASAPIGTGTGSYTFSATNLTLAIPVEAYSGIYTSAITITVLSTP